MSKLFYKVFFFIILSIIIFGVLLFALCFGYKRLIGIEKNCFTKKSNTQELESNQVGDIKIRIVADVNGKIFYSSQTVNYNDQVKLFLMIEKGGLKYCDNQKLISQGLTKPLSELKGFHPQKVKWSKVEAQYIFYTSYVGYRQTLSGVKKPIIKTIIKYYYQKYELNKFRYNSFLYKKNCNYISINQKSKTNYSIKLDNKYVGTMRYAVSAEIGEIKLSTPSVGYLNSEDFDKMDKVFRISVQGNTGNKILDYAFSYGNLPYYFGSNSRAWGWYGSDCAKYVCVVYWCLGYGIPYLSTLNLVINFSKKANITSMDDAGFYLSKGKKIKYGVNVKVGDPVVVSPTPYAHAGFIGEDKNRNGFLDKEDYVLHTSKRAPVYEKIGNTSLGEPNKNLFILNFYN